MAAERRWSTEWSLSCAVVGLLCGLSANCCDGQLPRDVQVETAGQQVTAGLERVAGFLATEQYSEAVDILVRLLETDGDALLPEARPTAAAALFREASAGELRAADGAASPAAAADFVHLQPVWVRCQGLLCQMSRRAPEALRAYRQRVDPLAQQWLERGIRARDERLLRRVATEMLASSHGDDALLAMGDLALDRGAVEVARSSWSSIHRELSAPRPLPAWAAAAGPIPLWRMAAICERDGRWAELRELWAADEESQRAELELPPGLPTAPDSPLPLPELRARMVLASLYARQWERARAEWLLLYRLHPEAAGLLGLSEGPLAASLAPWLLETTEETRRPPLRNWRMLGGGPERDGTFPHAIDVVGPPRWQTPLERWDTSGEQLASLRRQVGDDGVELLPCFPVVREGVVFLQQFGAIRALRLRDGQPAFGPAGASDVMYREDQRLWRHATATPHAGAPRWTLSLRGDRLFARGGPLLTGSSNAELLRGSTLLGFDLSSQGRMLPGFPIDCQASDLADAPGGWMFEGPPIAARGRLYAPVRRHDGVHASCHLDCYDLATSRRLWRTRICGGRPLAQWLRRPDSPAWDEWSRCELTLVDDTLYVCTNLGVIAAVDAERGQRLWATVYASSHGDDEAVAPWDREASAAVHRDRTPCLAVGELLIAAPRDSPSVMALERMTGRPIWATGPGECDDVVHLMGAAAGRAPDASAPRPQGDDLEAVARWAAAPPEAPLLIGGGERLYWIDGRSGRVRCQFPAGGSLSPGHAAPRPGGCGRGVLAGRTVLWPTRDRIYVFRQAPAGARPEAARAPIELTRRGARGGNLVLVEGTLLVASPDQLSAFEVRE